jgi:hypothetical protein
LSADAATKTEKRLMLASSTGSPTLPLEDDYGLGEPVQVPMPGAIELQGARDSFDLLRKRVILHPG